MTSETSTMQLIPFNFPRTEGHEFQKFMAKVQEMLEASDRISSITFDATYLGFWHSRMDFEDATEFPEVTQVTFKIRPGIFIDHTRGGKITGEQKELLRVIEKVSEWLEKHKCPKLRTVNLLWAETSNISWKYYTGYNDGYDSDGPIPETDYDHADEPLDCNLLVFYFMKDLKLDFSWLPESVTKLVLPGILYDCSIGRPDMEITYDHTETLEPDEEAFDSIIKKYVNWEKK